MTPAQAAYLKRLRDEGPQKGPRGGRGMARKAFMADLVEWETLGVTFRITPAGLAALEAYERAKEAQGLRK